MQTAQQDQSINPPANLHPAFEWLRSERIDSLNLVVEEYRHKKTGAQHFHLNADNDENVFLVGLRTIPMDSRGAAHILEHTVLCGSDQFPVRDPFFMMIRRSLNTFMNAFTSSDWTAYPFASKNKKDFNNLLTVYLDAVFHPRIHELDFAQEGHRLEFETADDPSSDLVYKGVVFNEMKGAMSSPISTLWQTLTEHLFPTTTYHYNSGGDPVNIPELSHEQLKEFYSTHYHPSNAIFMTYGNIPAHEHHARFETLALNGFERLDKHIAVEDEQRYDAPKKIEASYALDAAENTGDKTHIVMGWLLDKSTHLEDLLKAHLLEGILLDNGASPLRHALETTDIGSAPSPLCGVEDSGREMSFMCGIEGSSPDQADALEQLVLDTLNTIATDGIPQAQVEAVLHQLELSQREISGDSYPYGLQLILNALPTAIHRGDPIDVLNLDPVLASLHESIKDPDFIKQMVKDKLLNNPHRLRLMMKPDADLSQQMETDEKAKLAEIKAGLNQDDIKAILDKTVQLNERQSQQDDPASLPKVGREDIPKEMHIAEGTSQSIKGFPSHFYNQGTNGLIYQQIIIDLPALSERQKAILPYYTSALTELGCGKHSYIDMQARQSSVSGGIHAYTAVGSKTDNVQDISGIFVLSGKALAHNHSAFSDLLFETLNTVRFDEVSRIRELIAQKRAQKEQSITGQGHVLAMLAASSGMSPSAALSHQQRGLASIQFIKSLDDSLDEADNLKQLADDFADIHQIILNAPRQFLTIGEAEHHKALQADLEQHICKVDQAQDFSPLELTEIREPRKQLWTTSTQVNFCAKAYPTVPVDHKDASALSVLAGFLRNGFLHRAIREQGGAYGGGADHDSSSASFRFYSYRDPRLTETLDDFDLAIEWLFSEHRTPTEDSERQLEEAILGVVSSIDKPSSPAGEAKDAFHNELFERSREQRMRFRSRILAVTIDDLIHVAETYLKPENASIAAITNTATAEQLGEMDMEILSV